MPLPLALAKAELRQLDERQNEVNEQNWVMVQFNPETLKVSLSNQLSGDQKGTGGRQYVGEGTTKLSLQLWFDVTDPDTNSQENDVRRLTRKVAFFISPTEKVKEGQYIPPAVRFVWGSFQFDGVVESMEESLELFSPEGRPLRASVTLGLSQQKIDPYVIRTDKSPVVGPGARITGIERLTPAPAGSTLQGMAANVGREAEWWEIAKANRIEDPLRLPTGQLINLKAGG
ncbi:MAG TPA: hypothetical protein VFZ09_25175 [Archangium sp.]|uniref:CIS tube protein n=1 Tax=Archangium sp. TaxID=1872627 RepID=UPI002E33FB30|nr:hypothetical protein [Archangium sp.]HEX5749546.1 hypothetical protein [Archangium sp.]